jgi:hypothetical protein
MERTNSTMMSQSSVLASRAASRTVSNDSSVSSMQASTRNRLRRWA